jgi:hypothetical protein
MLFVVSYAGIVYVLPPLMSGKCMLSLLLIKAESALFFYGVDHAKHVNFAFDGSSGIFFFFCFDAVI